MKTLKQKSDASRKAILDDIARARNGRTLAYPEPDWEKNIYKEIEPSAEECFQNELKNVSGNCQLCPTENDVFLGIRKLMEEKRIAQIFCRDQAVADALGRHGIAHTGEKSDFTDMEMGITQCEYLVARTGSVMVSAASAGGRQMNIFPPVHVVWAKKSQLVPYVADALRGMREKYGTLPSSITNITGPSRTSDIEKTLVLGAHGPREIWVFIDLSA